MMIKCFKAEDMTEKEEDEKKNKKDDVHIGCAVCLQESCTFPMTLPDCQHTFCFLCIKGVATRSTVCPLCRYPIDMQLFNDPHLKQCSSTTNDDIPSHSASIITSQQWFYEARSGDGSWWRYEPRQEIELERAYLSSLDDNNRIIELLIAGHIYVIDLVHMIQYRRDIPDRRRRIRRGYLSSSIEQQTDDILIKGIAGLRL